MRLFSSGVFFALLLVSFGAGPFRSVRAAGSAGLAVSPAFQEIVLAENETEKKFTVSLTNTTEKEVTLRVAAYDFRTLDESGGVAFLGASSDLSKKYALASWLHPDKDVITLGSGEAENIAVTIENQDMLGPGGHYGALVFKTEDATGAQSGDAVSVNQLFSTLVFVKKLGGEIYHLNLREAEYHSSPLRFQGALRLHFENQGNVHVAPRGVATVMDPLGRTVWKGIVNEESALVLPETTRVYTVRLKPQAMDIIPGRYTMTIRYRYDGEEFFTTTTLQFDFIPLPAILCALALLATGGWYVAKRRRKTGEKVASKSHSSAKLGDA